ncbi:MAG: DUF3180 domain-containing protein [Bowdeniella nasicola]|nr:DUF3180 domain-containing protein [Bowdeniella nasicola]
MVTAIGSAVIVNRTTWTTLATLFALIAPISYVILTVIDARLAAPLPVSWANAIVLAIVAFGLWRAGVAVKKYVAKDDTRMDAIGAARVALGAKTCALGGASLAGYFTAQSVIGIHHLAVPLYRDHALAAGAATLTAVILASVAMLVESWCVIPPDDDDNGNICHTPAT